MCEIEIVSCRVLSISPTITALLRKVHCNALFCATKRFAKPRPRNAPPGRFRLAGRKARGTGCSNPPFCCSIKSMQNKKSSTPQGAALGATGRIRTSGLPGRRTTTGRYRPALKREFCWVCTAIVTYRKSPLLVITTGFSGVLWCRCTVVVKWWSGYSGRHYIFGT